MNYRIKVLSLLSTMSILLASGCSNSPATVSNDSIKGIAINNSDGLKGGIVAGDINGPSGIMAAEDAMIDSAVYPYDDFNTEEYSSISENGFKSTVSDPLSTFSIDVDTASYSDLKWRIENGQDVYEDAVRIEEMINYFNYNYAEPKDNEPFSVNVEYADCPWNADAKLMRIGLHSQSIDIENRDPMNLVFLIDTSGSMTDAMELVKDSFKMLTKNLTAKDRISIVTYAGDSVIALEGSDDPNEVVRVVDSLMAGGGTNGADGINTAYALAEKYFIKDGTNRIILATDGDFNIGQTTQAQLESLIEEKRKSGVYLSVLGFANTGWYNYNDVTGETLADKGNGNYSIITDEKEARRVLSEQMTGTLITVAKDVKIQVEFNPAYIKGYRLIGYENRALANEDFNDDTKDAGEIGAGHSVTAIYEIIDKDSKFELNTSNLKYTDNSNLGSENGELLTINIRYKDPNGSESKLLTYPIKNIYTSEMSADTRFAAAVVEFGMLLRDSEFKGTSNKDSILQLLSECDFTNDEYKFEFQELVKRADVH